MILKRRFAFWVVLVYIKHELSLIFLFFCEFALFIFRLKKVHLSSGYYFTYSIMKHAPEQILPTGMSDFYNNKSSQTAKIVTLGSNNSYIQSHSLSKRQDVKH